MNYHILNGDAIAEKFADQEISGKIVVIRESFIEGPLTANFTEEYWDKRAAFISEAYGADKEDYEEQFLSQLTILNSITSEDEICLWFEDDLFCIMNLLFTIYYLSQKSSPAFYRIFPERDEKHWSGFGKTTKKELVHLFDSKQRISDEDIALSNQLWEALVSNDREKLKALSYSDTDCFRYLPQVIQAHLDRMPVDGSTGRPHQTLVDILNEGKTNFYEIFEEFWKKEAIYGFGDVQVYNMLREMEIEFSGDLL
ncbi:MAG TPA: DUF1835 domain-containing protein [Saprospiraceae bacterium]|nr:DUF1835 domain-containing protein [Saprospiraceae bacterium]